MGRLAIILCALLLCCSVPRFLAASFEVELGDGLRKDAAVLQAFWGDLWSDAFGILDSWGKGPNPCEWSGVECGRVSTPGSPDGEYRVIGLDLWGLEVGGVISPEIGKLSELQTLALVGCKLEGQIPTEIRNCHKLTTLDLRANLLSGPIDFSLTDLPLLETLKLSENDLTGKLNVLFSEKRASYNPFHFLGGWVGSESQQPPSSMCSNLKVLDLGKNSLSGQIPPAMGGCSELSEVNLNGNRLVGAIPTTLSALSQLHVLLLSDNRLDGPFPAALAECKDLHLLDVSNNLLDGGVPSEISELETSQQFNFANNKLKGKMPAGRWRLQQMVMEGKFDGNPNLCGWPLKQQCSSSRLRASHKDPSSWLQRWPARLCKPVQAWMEQASSLGLKGRIGSVHRALRSPRRSLADSSHRKSHKVRRWAIGLSLGLVAGALAALLVATILRLFVFYMQKTPYLHGPIIFHPNISPRMLVFLEKDDALSGLDFIGEGAAGKVYKVQLENEKAVAVKSVEVRDDQRGLLGQKQIQSELETLGCIRHRNLVSLLAYVHRPNTHLLLYEYMKNGSLSHALSQVNAGNLELPWPIRHKIAVGTAQGLSYLHFQSNPKIVHRDLKPSNILLDEDFKAHVADFGLAKIIPNNATHVSTGVAGTVGYIAPEYNEACRFTEMCDVYSFGVVLAVLLTGKDPKDPFFQTVPGGTIASWLHGLMQRPDAKEAIDPHLRTEEGNDDDQILLALKVAAFCTLSNPAKRPSSKDALVMLTQIREDTDVHVPLLRDDTDGEV